MSTSTQMFLAFFGGPVLFVLACGAWEYPGTAAIIIGVLLLPFIGAVVYGACTAIDDQSERRRRDDEAARRAVLDSLRPR